MLVLAMIIIGFLKITPSKIEILGIIIKGRLTLVTKILSQISQQVIAVPDVEMSRARADFVVLGGWA